MKNKIKPRVSVAHSKIPFVLGLLGGIFTTIIGIISILLMLNNIDNILLVMSIIGIVSGGLVIYGTSLLTINEKFKTGSLLMIIFSVVSLITLQGLIIGPIVGLIGGILTYVRKMI